MTSRENIARYVDSLVLMKKVFESNDNQSFIREWGDVMFEYIQTLDGEQDGQRTLSLNAISEAARIVAEQDIRRLKRDEIYIPV